MIHITHLSIQRLAPLLITTLAFALLCLGLAALCLVALVVVTTVLNPRQVNEAGFGVFVLLTIYVLTASLSFASRSLLLERKGTSLIAAILLLCILLSLSPWILLGISLVQSTVEALIK